MRDYQITGLAKELAEEFRRKHSEGDGELLSEDSALIEACEELLILQKRLHAAERAISAGFTRNGTNGDDHGRRRG